MAGEIEFQIEKRKVNPTENCACARQMMDIMQEYKRPQGRAPISRVHHHVGCISDRESKQKHLSDTWTGQIDGEKTGLGGADEKPAYRTAPRAWTLPPGSLNLVHSAFTSLRLQVLLSPPPRYVVPNFVVLWTKETLFKRAVCEK